MTCVNVLTLQRTLKKTKTKQKQTKTNKQTKKHPGIFGAIPLLSIWMVSVLYKMNPVDQARAPIKEEYGGERAKDLSRDARLNDAEREVGIAF